MDPIVKAEFVALLNTMTADEIKKYRRRIMDGKFDGWTYVSKNCGCAYGTWAYVKKLASPRIDYDGFENENKLDDVINVIKNQKLPFRDPIFHPIMTPLENYVKYVDEGDKPKDSIILDNLVDEIDLYLKEKSE